MKIALVGGGTAGHIIPSISVIEKIQEIAPLNQIKVLPYRDKQDWILETKYNIGTKKKKVEETA